MARARLVFTLLTASVVFVPIVAAPDAGASPVPHAACTSTWAGAAGASWQAGANWSPHGVPTAASVACVFTAGGPTVIAGSPAVARELRLTGTSVVLHDALTVQSFDLAHSTVGGDATLTATEDTAPRSQLSDVAVTGSTEIASTSSIDIIGAGSTCGSGLAVCLSGSARIEARIYVFVYGDVGGSTDADPAIIVGDLAGVVNEGSTVHISVPVTGQLDVLGVYPAPPGTLRVDDWSGLDANGMLTARIDIDEPGTLILPRPIRRVGADGLLIGSQVRTPDGGDALIGLSRLDPGGYVQLTESRTLRPAGGVLVNNGTLAVEKRSSQDPNPNLELVGSYAGGGHFNGQAHVTGSVRVSDTSYFDVYGPTSASAVTVAGHLRLLGARSPARRSR